MKRFILLIVVFLLGVITTVQAEEAVTLKIANDDSFIDNVLASTEIISNPILQVPMEQDNEEQFNIQNRSALLDYEPETKQTSKFFLNNVITQTARDVYNLKIEQNTVPEPLLKDRLTFNFEKGPLDSVHLWSAYQMNFLSVMPERGDSDTTFDFGFINVLIDGKLKGGKENFRIMLDPTHRHNHQNFMQTFFQDLFVETHRIPHHTILIGNSRPGVGVEGAQSPYTLAFLNRSQLSRNLSNARKLGVRLRGDYSLVDYDLGLYSSATNFTDFFPGQEVDAWLNLKPLGKTDGKYGHLTTGAGVQAGERHGTSYNVTGAYVGYDYKKFWTKFEYADANGSNGGSGLTRNHSQGFFVTLAYRLTQKLEVLARFDDFDSDKNIKHNNQKEYTLGANYYIKGQALKLIFNYIYCQNDAKVDSHKLMVGTQIIL